MPCVNLVKKGIFYTLMTPNKNPLTLVTANGERLKGGDREVELDLDFKMKIRGQKKENEFEVFTLKGNFHEAEIEDELILGYPWLRENNLDILTTEGALGCGWENEILLTGWEKEDFDETEQLDEYPVTWKVRELALHLTEETDLFGETD